MGLLEIEMEFKRDQTLPIAKQFRSSNRNKVCDNQTNTNTRINMA